MGSPAAREIRGGEEGLALRPFAAARRRGAAEVPPRRAQALLSTATELEARLGREVRAAGAGSGRKNLWQARRAAGARGRASRGASLTDTSPPRAGDRCPAWRD